MVGVKWLWSHLCGGNIRSGLFFGISKVLKVGLIGMLGLMGVAARKYIYIY